MFRLGDLIPGAVEEIMKTAIQRKNDQRKDDIEDMERSGKASVGTSDVYGVNHMGRN
jgi:hypothetical protein